ncbi:ferredoxin [Clostridium tarantellae]|uniref:Ferredoxin n=1 Tax=Clostridium tarantellae TaxID=39493 RepID=A0A6I1MNR9_9CLOT|nr:ferredoxin [Clostridium tarantellae]MPQ44684.1 4Fe-4S dicluster domain-containing protein [Clostridium tarantellae]
MRAVVDEEVCIGCGMCVESCPEVFTLDENGKAIADNEFIPEYVLNRAEESYEDCPVNAISIEDGKD